MARGRISDTDRRHHAKRPQADQTETPRATQRASDHLGRSHVALPRFGFDDPVILPERRPLVEPETALAVQPRRKNLEAARVGALHTVVPKIVYDGASLLLIESGG